MSLSKKQRQEILILLEDDHQKSVEKVIDFFKSNLNLQSTLIELIKEIINDKKVLFINWLALLGETEMLEQLVYAGVAIDISDDNGNTPLHFAIQNEQFDATLILLEEDLKRLKYNPKNNWPALTKLKNQANETPEDVANKLKNTQILKLINNYDKQFYLIQNKDEDKLEFDLINFKNSGKNKSESIIPKPILSLPTVSHGVTQEPAWVDAACKPEFSWLTKSTGQIQWKDLSSNYTLDQNVSGQRWGSGCLIADNLFLTAGHCFDPQLGKNKNDWKLVDEYTQEPLSPKEFPALMTVNFGYEYSSCPKPDKTIAIQPQEEKFSVLRLAEYRLGNLDYAVIELDGNPGKKFGTVTLSVAIPEVSEQLVVSQHPSGQIKKVDNGSIVCAENICTRGNKVYYQLDTEPGSSGSPVGRIKNKTVVAVHTNGFNLDQNDIPANSGVTIEAIKKVSNILNDSRYSFFSTNSTNESKVVNSYSNTKKYAQTRYPLTEITQSHHSTETVNYYESPYLGSINGNQ